MLHTVLDDEGIREFEGYPDVEPVGCVRVNDRICSISELSAPRRNFW